MVTLNVDYLKSYSIAVLKVPHSASMNLTGYKICGVYLLFSNQSLIVCGV